jgi:hypothetical protein
MSANTFWSDRLTMLMACASPGSAWAYHLGLATFETGLLRRDIATDEPAEPAAKVEADEPQSDVTELVASGRVLALP